MNSDIVAKTKESIPEKAKKSPATFERNETVRIEAFSDGVFAIAITLLVLGIKVPKANKLGAGGSLGSTLIKLWPHYLALRESTQCDTFLRLCVGLFIRAWYNAHVVQGNGSWPRNSVRRSQE